MWALQTVVDRICTAGMTDKASGTSTVKGRLTKSQHLAAVSIQTVSCRNNKKQMHPEQRTKVLVYELRPLMSYTCFIAYEKASKNSKLIIISLMPCGYFMYYQI
jgi:hypothetical protein